MNREDIQLRFCKYKISRFEIVIPNRDEPFVLDEAHIGNWSIEKDFENYFFPFMEFRCMVPDTIYTEIMQTSENVYVDLKVEYAYFEDTYEMDPAAMLFTYDKLLESRYYAFIANRSPKLTDALLGEKDKDAENPANQTSFVLLQDKIRELLSTLPQREQEVLRMRFGLDDGYALTLEEVGLYFDVTRERIRQIEAKALRRLRFPTRSKKLKDWNE